MTGREFEGVETIPRMLVVVFGSVCLRRRRTNGSRPQRRDVGMTCNDNDGNVFSNGGGSSAGRVLADEDDDGAGGDVETIWSDMVRSDAVSDSQLPH